MGGGGNSSFRKAPGVQQERAPMGTYPPSLTSHHWDLLCQHPWDQSLLPGDAARRSGPDLGRKVEGKLPVAIWKTLTSSRLRGEGEDKVIGTRVGAPPLS
ncbi:Hypothetical predicted protein [Marmota monax]|uniref:Uncharacterized protein n=1 Tax=Marmota monax TaxID=9995 RepID=A0A5E4BLP1_MARMO|nr:hypothetical protein GHT09_005330 [Marmota monax]VTJ69901.1 Hypothetical predicted protein [Marmota monax]